MWTSVLLGLIAAQETSPPPPPPGVKPEVALFARAKRKMADALVGMPNYTCLQTIERSKRAAKRRKFELIDVLRLEVGLVEGRELFAWPGSGKFEDKELSDLVPAGGAIGNGSFAAHAAAVFRNNVASITYTGEDQKSRLRKYDFRVPQNLSGYRLRSGKSLEAVIGYHGSFYVDASNDRVMRIELAGDDIPAFLEVLGNESSIDYNLVRIGDRDYWLPVASTMSITNLDSTEYRNEIRFSGCRQFAGESTLKFDEAPVDSLPTTAPPSDEPVTLPANKFFAVSLDQAIKWGSTATGDIVEATLVSDIKGKSGALLFAKGSKVTGRVTRMQFDGARQTAEVEFSEIRDGARHAAFKAQVNERPEIANMRPAGMRPHMTYVFGSAKEPGRMTLVTTGNRLALDKGARISWFSLP